MKKRTKKQLEAQAAFVKRAAETHHLARLKREAEGKFKATFVRLTLTDDAYAAIGDRRGLELREFASEAMRRAAKTKKMAIPTHP